MNREKPQISIIVAIAKNWAIGKDNRLLWHLSDDLKRFKALTMGHTIVMGRNTFFSLPRRPLPGRHHIVLTNIPDEKIEGCEMALSIEEAIAKMPRGEESFVIGGASVYSQFLPLADKLYITWVDREYEADAFFPKFDESEWEVESQEDHHETDEKNPIPYRYVIYRRK
ncbi:MAG: dihydrofolate reductase [Bacteroidales bacterium]